jgi:hypothetical protein
MSKITLTRAQYEALGRLDESLSDRSAIKRIHLDYEYDAYLRVSFDAGWGKATFDVDLEGNSAPVNFGESEISLPEDHPGRPDTLTNGL